MNTPLPELRLSAPISGGVKKKRVLLIDTSHAKRDLRAEVLRKLGMDVDTAADIAEALMAETRTVRVDQYGKGTGPTRQVL